jgi:transposase
MDLSRRATSELQSSVSSATSHQPVEFEPCLLLQAKTHISVVDDQGKELWHGSVTTSPDALALAVQEHAAGVIRVGMESGPLSPWLFHALKAKGLPIICIDAKAAKAGLQLQGPNKTDRKDANGIARVMQTGWYREVTVKEIEGHKRQTALTVRKQLVGMRTECINLIRGILKMYGKVLPSGKLPPLKELILADDLLAKAISAVYSTLQTLSSEIKQIDKEIELLAGEDEYCKVLQTIPGIGKITAFAFAASIGDPKRFRKSRSVGAYLGMTCRRDQSGQKDISASAAMACCAAIYSKPRALSLREPRVSRRSRPGVCV